MNKQLLMWGGLAILLGIGVAAGLPQAKANSSAVQMAQAPEAPFQIAQAPAAAAGGGQGDWMQMVMSPSKETIAKGQASYAQCAACHGMTGKGDGAPLTPKPRNFHAKDGWKNGRDLPAMYKTLEEGIPGGPMQAYNYLPAAERMAIIHYIRTFTDYPPITKEQAMEMEKKYNLSTALMQTEQKKTPIAVGTAMNKLVEEYAPTLQKIESQLESFTSKPEAALFLHHTYDAKRALVMLHNSDGWKKNLDTFKMVVTGALGNNGFEPSVTQLTAAEWSKLFQFISKI